jgi:glycerophosphoryl diester phosphodiesterase
VADVQVIAHRGSSGTHAEHTLQAFDAAISEGAHALECDVRLTRDGVLVCVHNRRVNRTSNGRGAVSALELADLSELDFTAWKRPQRPDRDPVEESDRDHGRVLTLERLLQLVLDAARPVRLHVETKHPTRHGGRVERALVDLLTRYGLVTSRSPACARSTLIHRVRDRGGWVQVFTVDQPRDVDYLVQLGVDAIISNYPALVLHRLAQQTPSRPAGRRGDDRDVPGRTSSSG